MDWAYRREAFVWVNQTPVRPNMIPFAAQMGQWLRRDVVSPPLHTKLDSGVVGELENPYSYSLSAISFVICAAINDASDFSEATESVDMIDAEVKRIRLESELTLNAARFCEAAIKQMLFCTQVPSRMYQTASMGQLLARDCESCKRADRKRHDISLLGSLAHRFFLCHMLDSCATDHLQLIARRRNLEAAHSDSQSIHPRSAVESRKHLARSLFEIGTELKHMVDHIGDIEAKLISEINLNVRSYPKYPPRDELSKVPVRDLNQYPRENLSEI